MQKKSKKEKNANKKFNINRIFDSECELIMRKEKYLKMCHLAYPWKMEDLKS